MLNQYDVYQLQKIKEEAQKKEAALQASDQDQFLTETQKALLTPEVRENFRMFNICIATQKEPPLSFHPTKKELDHALRAFSGYLKDRFQLIKSKKIDAELSPQETAKRDTEVSKIESKVQDFFFDHPEMIQKPNNKKCTLF